MPHWTHLLATGGLTFIISIVSFAGIIYRTWVLPMRQEREELIRWRADQEAKDAAHETRMALIEQRLDKGDDKFERLLEGQDDLKERLIRLDESLAQHRSACEKKG